MKVSFCKLNLLFFLKYKNCPIFVNCIKHSYWFMKSNMFNRLILLIITLFVISITGYNSSYGQATYCYTQSSSVYVDIALPVSINNGVVWDDSTFFIPIGFTFNFFGSNYDTLALNTNGILYPYDSIGIYDLKKPIMPFGSNDSTTNLIDRGYGSAFSLSPISYELSGSSGSRILKIEFKNAGFQQKLPTLAEYTNVQAWLYEGTNQIEFHHGSTTANSSCFNGATGPAIGIGNVGSYTGYYLNGDPITPVLLDTISNLDSSPLDGTVYGFLPSVIQPSISIVSDINPPCADNTITFTATPINGGSPTYQWKKNGIDVGTNTTTYTDNTFVDSDDITCFLTSSLVCSNSLPTLSNRIIILKPLADIEIFTDTSGVCGNKIVSFTIFTQNEGLTPSYQWTKNGINVGTDTAYYDYSNPLTNDTIQCILTSNEYCVTGSPATSNKIGLLRINPLITSIGIVADKDSICYGETIIFTASDFNGGSTPEYLWYKNNSLQPDSITILTDAFFTQGDTIYCKLISSNSCVVSDTVSSGKLTVKVKPQLQPSISISIPSTTICSAQSASLSSSVTNGGLTPSYQWKINGINAGINTGTFTYSGFVDKDTVSCIATSSLQCGVSDTSTSIILIVLPSVTPTINIIADKDSVCTGQGITFTANTTYGGSAPSYQWKVNNGAIGTSNNSYFSSSLVDGDIILCELTSNEACYTQAIVPSNTITSRIVSYSTASSTITSSQSTVCNSTTVNFNATAASGGNSPIYQWKKNNLNVGTNSNTYSFVGFNNNDKVRCVITSSLFCVNGSPANSNEINMNVISTGTSAITIAPDQNPVCTGGKVKFTSSVIGTSSPVYQWKLNTIPIGINSSVFTLTNMANGDQVTCELTNAINCSGTIPSSNLVTLSINASLDPTISILTDKTTICTTDTVTFTAAVIGAGNSPLYEWRKNSILVGTNSSIYEAKNLLNNDEIICSITTASNCSANSNTISLNVTTCLGTLSEKELESLKIYPNPFTDIVNFNFLPESKTTISIIDFMGREIFTKELLARIPFEESISTFQLTKGIYLVRIINENGFYTEKFIKN